MSKLSYLQEHHILIPKDGKRKDDKQMGGMGDEEYLGNLQEEVRKLHYQLKQKESVIERLRVVVNQPADNEEAQQDSLKLKKLNSLFDKDDSQDQ